MGPKWDPIQPHLPAISDPLKGRFPILSPSPFCPGPWDSQPRVDSAPGQLSATGCPTVKWVRGGPGEGSETRRNDWPGRAPHDPIPRHSTRRPSAYPGVLHRQVFTVFTWAEDLLGSERQEKVCRGFKVIPRSSCLRRRGAAHGSPAAPGGR